MSSFGWSKSLQRHTNVTLNLSATQLGNTYGKSLHEKSEKGNATDNQVKNYSQDQAYESTCTFQFPVTVS